MKKHLILLITVATLCVGLVSAAPVSKSQLVGWWQLKEKEKTTEAASTVRKLYFTQDNYFFSVTYSSSNILPYNCGQYGVFNDGTVATYHQDNQGKPYGLANTYRIEFSGDSLHLYGFYFSKVQGVPEEKYESVLVDEWWVRQALQTVKPTEKPIMTNEKGLTWVKKKTAKSPVRKALNGTGTFFRSDSAVVCGYITDYMNLTNQPMTGIIFTNNDITNESIPIALEIQKDGRFEAKIPLTYPKLINLMIGRTFMECYLEPGQVLGLVFDWKDLFVHRGLNNSRLVEFYGPLATINQQLLTIRRMKVDNAKLKQALAVASPQDFVAAQADDFRSYEVVLRVESREYNYSQEVLDIAWFEAFCNNSLELFEFEQQYERVKRDSAVSKPPLVASDYFKFLEQLPLNDPRLLISSNFSVFINRFEFSSVYFNRQPIVTSSSPAKQYGDYLADECQVVLTPEEKAYFNWRDTTTYSVATPEIKAKNAYGERIVTKYKQFQKGYIDKYVLTIKRMSLSEMQHIRWHKNDSTFQSMVGVKPNLITEIAKTRYLTSLYRNMSLKEATDFLSQLDPYITQPFLKSEAKRLFTKQFSQPLGYTLSTGKDADVFKQLIAPFKGKLVFVDFWATTCGPCVSNIQYQFDLRKAYKNNPDVAFVFVTDESSSPLTDYQAFVAKQELENTFRLPDSQFILLRQLFKFSAIPHYVLVGSDGLIINDDYQMSNLNNDIKKFVK